MRRDVPTVALPGEVDTDALVELSVAAAREAGVVITERRPERLGVAATKSSPTDIVTEMDHAAEDVILSLLRRVRPQDGLLAEESGLRVGDSGLTWVIDPIDGTVNYLYDLPAYAVSVAVVAGDPRDPGRWRPLAGCVHNPVSGQTWTAGEGTGAFLDGRRLALAEPPGLDRALVGTGFGYRRERRERQAAVLASVLPRVRDIRRMGAASLDLCMVADGRLDAFYEQGLNPWDMAAAALVVLEAGGSVTGLGGLPPGERMVVAAAEPLCSSLAAALLQAGA